MRNNRRKVPYIFLTIFIIFGILLTLPGLIFADDSPGGGSGGTSFKGNYNVGDLPPGLIGFKIDCNPPVGKYPADNPVIEITEKIGDDEDDYGIKWKVCDPSVTVYIVAMKGGNYTNVYDYPSGATSGTNFTSINPNNGKNFEISHIVFGYKVTDETTTTIPDETTTTVPDETTTTVTDETTTTIPDETTTTVTDETTTTVTDETTTTVTDETTTTIPGNTTTTVPGDTTTTVPGDITTTVPDTVTTVLGIQETRRVDVLGVQETGQIDVLGIQELPFTGLRENLVILGLMFIITGLMTMILIPVLRRAGKH